MFGLLIAFGALMLRLNEIAFGEADRQHVRQSRRPIVPLFAHLGLVVVAGIYLPGTARRLVPGRGTITGLEDRPMAFVAALKEKGRTCRGPSSLATRRRRRRGVAAGHCGCRRR